MLIARLTVLMGAHQQAHRALPSKHLCDIQIWHPSVQYIVHLDQTTCYGQI